MRIKITKQHRLATHKPPDHPRPSTDLHYPQALLREARQRIDAAHAEKHLQYAAVHAYYAMFYAASALLAAQGEEFASHAEVVGSIGKRARMDVGLREFHRALLEAWQLRMAGDYGKLSRHARGKPVEFNKERLDALIAHAESFIAFVEKIGR